MFKGTPKDSADPANMSVPKILDIQNILEQYAWQHFLDIETARRHKGEFKGIEQEDVEFEVNLKKLQIIHGEPDYVNLNPTSAKPYTLFKTVFTNNTQRPQEYSFKTERSTESIALVFREQGYTLGQEAELSLKTPCEILEFKAGFKHEMSLNKAHENSIAERLTWGVDSNISVPPRFCTTAQLVVEEMSYSGSFVLQTRLSGRVTVTLIRRKDGAIVLPVTVSITEVFRDMLESGPFSRDIKALATVDRNSVRLTSKGQCSFQFAMKQKVEINEQTIDEAQEENPRGLKMVD